MLLTELLSLKLFGCVLDLSCRCVVHERSAWLSSLWRLGFQERSTETTYHGGCFDREEMASTIHSVTDMENWGSIGSARTKHKTMSAQQQERFGNVCRIVQITFGWNSGPSEFGLAPQVHPNRRLVGQAPQPEQTPPLAGASSIRKPIAPKKLFCDNWWSENPAYQAG